MNRIKQISAALLLAASLAWVGCKATLAPGGAYSDITTNTTVTADSGGVLTTNVVLSPAPDLPLFIADSAYRLAYSTIDAVFTSERQNRTFLWSLSPTIKHTLDGIRPQAVQFNLDYLTARAAYIANPVPTNLAGVQAVLAKIQQIATAAQAALPKGA
jgi:hypothetical protein